MRTVRVMTASSDHGHSQHDQDAVIPLCGRARGTQSRTQSKASDLHQYLTASMVGTQSGHSQDTVPNRLRPRVLPPIGRTQSGSVAARRGTPTSGEAR
jgi:hypothetical protein